MNFDKVLRENKIVLNELKISALIKNYKKGRFIKSDAQRDPGQLIGTLTDDNLNPILYDQATELVKDYGYKEIPSDLDTLLKTGTQSHEANVQQAKLEKEKKAEQRGKIKGGSIVRSRKYT